MPRIWTTACGHKGIPGPCCFKGHPDLRNQGCDPGSGCFPGPYSSQGQIWSPGLLLSLIEMRMTRVCSATLDHFNVWGPCYIQVQWRAWQVQPNMKPMTPGLKWAMALVVAKTTLTVPPPHTYTPWSNKALSINIARGGWPEPEHLGGRCYHL